MSTPRRMAASRRRVPVRPPPPHVTRGRHERDPARTPSWVRVRLSPDGVTVTNDGYSVAYAASSADPAWALLAWVRSG